ncbi:MAG: hypothetical protein ACKOBS_03300 [Verrucomicrobiota bacterium]
MSAAPYHLAERGVGVGVWSAAEVEAGLATGRLSPAVLSWREGEPGWIVLAARPEFAPAIGAFRSLVPPSTLAFDDAPLLRLDWTAWARTMRAIWGSPRQALRASAASVSLSRAFCWVIVCATLAAPFLYLQLTLAGAASGDASAARFQPGAHTPAPVGLDLPRFAAFCAGFPLAVVVSVFGGACLLHAFLLAVGGGRAGFRATTRIMAYVGGAMLMPAVVPCGWALAPFVMLAYLSVSLREAHRDAAWKPLLALAAAGFCSVCVATAFMALAVRPFFRPMG